MITLFSARSDFIKKF